MASYQKRTTADGSVRWTMRVFIGRDEAGKRKFVTRTFARKKDAQAAARRLEQMKEGGPLTVTSKEPLSAYLDRWMKGKRGTVRARTAHEYANIIRRYIQDPPEGAPPLGAIRLNRLGHEAFTDLYSWMQNERGLSVRTIQYTHVVLRMALADAVEKGELPKNPTDYATRPTEALDGASKRAMRAMSREQADAFLLAAREDRYHALWALLLTGGLRPGEALGLRWDDVDMEAGRVHIQHALVRRGVEGWRLMEPKTENARRVVPLPLVTMHALRTWRATQGRERLQLGAEYADHGAGGFVFATEFGQPLDQSHLYHRHFRPIMQRAELGKMEEVTVGKRVQAKRQRFRPAFRVYDLRHTAATLLLLQGVNVKVVSERLGHADVSLTLKVYSHVLPEMQETAVAALDQMFGAGG